MVILNGSISLNKIQEVAANLTAHTNGDTYVPVSIFVKDELNGIGQQVEIKEAKSKEEREAMKEQGQYPAQIGGGWVGMAGEVSKAEAEGDDLPF